MFALAQTPIYSQPVSSQNANAAEVYAPTRTEYLHSKDDEKLEQGFLRQYKCKQDDEAAFQAPGRISYSEQAKTKVIIKKVLRTALQDAAEIDREITVRCAARDPSIMLLVESLELKDVIWTATEYRRLDSLADKIAVQGPMPEHILTTALNQLFSGIASIFMSGFAHLRVNAETICLDQDGQIVITGLQYVSEYGKEKTDDLYAATREKFGDDIYVAPEVFEKIEYNARKACLWSCGVLFYFMAAGQTQKLSVLNHPSLESSPDYEEFESSNSRSRRATIAGHPIHHSNLENKIENAGVQSKLLLALARSDVPNYARSIIPKMLNHDPHRRSELIEIVTRIPKVYAIKDPRPLMELAWLDYKTHVGPLAGLDLGEDHNQSSGSSIYSMASAMSNPFRSLMGRRHSKNDSLPKAWQ